MFIQIRPFFFSRVLQGNGRSRVQDVGTGRKDRKELLKTASVEEEDEENQASVPADLLFP